MQIVRSMATVSPIHGGITFGTSASASSSTASLPLFLRSLVFRMLTRSLRSASGVYRMMVSYPNLRIIRSIRLLTLTLKCPLASCDQTMRLGTNFSRRGSIYSFGNDTRATLINPIAERAILRLFEVKNSSIVDNKLSMISDDSSSRLATYRNNVPLNS